MVCFNFVWVSGRFVGIHAVSNMCNCSEVHLLFMQSRYSELFGCVNFVNSVAKKIFHVHTFLVFTYFDHLVADMEYGV